MGRKAYKEWDGNIVKQGVQVKKKRKEIEARKNGECTKEEVNLKGGKRKERGKKKEIKERREMSKEKGRSLEEKEKKEKTKR